MDKLNAWWSAHRPSTRCLVQLYTALLYNAHLKGFAEGEIYRGRAKGLCVPGLNCYSCPAAVGACPLGALQNAVAASASRPAFYAVGVLLLFGLLLGRVICGWACPMGLLQELLHKLPTPKLKKGKLTRALSWVKYALLAALVLAVPLYYAFRRTPLPAFCKYICPAGTLEGALGLLLHPANGEKLGLLGPLFTNKFILLVLILTACVFLYRAFCRFLCPLGAIYGLMSRLALLGVKLDKAACTDCGVCRAVCPMDIRHVGDRECISCGKCVAACPERAISFRAGKATVGNREPGTGNRERGTGNGGQGTEKAFPLRGRCPSAHTGADEVVCDSAAGGEERAANSSRRRRTLAWALALALLAGALVGFNLPAASPEASEPPETASQNETLGNRVGERLPDFAVETLEGGRFALSAHRGQVVVLNLWATWCGPCVKELPYFEAFAAAHPDAALLAVHGELITEDVEAWLAGAAYQNIPFAIDADGAVARLLGASSMLPHTVVLDQNGVVIYNAPGSVTPALLEELYQRAATN